MEPTSPAKHFAFPFGRKLKKQNTITLRMVTNINEGSTNPICSFNKYNGNNTANAYPAVIPLIPSIKLMTFVIPTYTTSAKITTHQRFQCKISIW